MSNNMRLTQEELNQIVADHKAWLKDPTTGKQADLSGKNISYLSLAHAVLDDSILDGVIAIGVDFYKATLRRVILIDATLSGSNLTETKLTDAICIRVDFSNIVSINSTFIRANCDYAIFSGSLLRYVDFEDARLVNVDFEDATVCKLDLRGTVLTNTNLPISLGSYFLAKIGWYPM